MPIFSVLQIPKLVTLAKKGRIAPVYLFLGQEELCKEKAKEVLKVIEQGGAVVEAFNLKEKEQKEEFYATKGMQESLFGLRKVYVVFGAEEITPEKAKSMIETLKTSQMFTWFLIASSMDQRHPIYEFAKEKGAVIPFLGKKEEDYLESELVLTLKNSGKSMDRSCANLFLSLVGKDFSYFKLELEKVILYTGNSPVITEEDVRKVVSPVQQSALYLLADAFFSHGPQKAYEVVLSLLDQKFEAPQILKYLYRYFKKMAILKEFLKKHPELAQEEKYFNFLKKFQELKDSPVEELPKPIAESHPYALFTMKRHLKKVKNLDAAFKLLFKTDLAIKRDFQNPAKAFNTLFIDLWLEMQQN